MKPNMISKAMDIVREGVQKNSQDKVRRGILIFKIQ
jgi:hypothetical protein